MRKNTGTA